MQTAYIRFLNLIESLDEFNELTPIQHFIIKKIAVMWGRKEKVTVTKILKFKSLASPSTLYRELTQLKKLGYLKLKPNMIDRRIKEVMPTPKLIKLQDKFEGAFSKAITL